MLQGPTSVSALWCLHQLLQWGVVGARDVSELLGCGLTKRALHCIALHSALGNCR